MNFITIKKIRNFKSKTDISLCHLTVFYNKEIYDYFKEQLILRVSTQIPSRAEELNMIYGTYHSVAFGLYLRWESYFYSGISEGIRRSLCSDCEREDHCTECFKIWVLPFFGKNLNHLIIPACKLSEVKMVIQEVNILVVKAFEQKLAQLKLIFQNDLNEGCT